MARAGRLNHAITTTDSATALFFLFVIPRGRTVAFGGRVLGDDKPKYLNSPETDVFHKSAELYGLFENRKVSSKLSRFLIVEGYMDVIALAQSGINYAVATLGTATNAGHLQRLFSPGTGGGFLF